MATNKDKEKKNKPGSSEIPPEYIPEGPGHLLKKMLREKGVKALDLVDYIERDFNIVIEVNRIYRIYQDVVKIRYEEANMIIISGGLDGGEYQRRLVPFTKKSAIEGEYSKLLKKNKSKKEKV